MPLAVSFIKSAVHVIDYPEPTRPEIALAGRSNAGKSSFLNAITRSKIAKISQEPGKTRLLNFFEVGDHYRVVDMPGYGFAARAGKEVHDWSEMVETYLENRGNMVGLILVMDIRRDWTQDEEMLSRFMTLHDKPMLIILAKADQCKPHEIRARTALLKKQSQRIDVWPVSSTKNTGIEEVEDYFFREWIKPFLGRKK